MSLPLRRAAIKAAKALPLSQMKPMKHQAVSLKHADKTDIVFDTSDPGTGKTAVRAWAFSKRRRKGGGCALVFAPRSLLRTVWEADFKKVAPDMTISVATAANRAAAFAVDSDVYVTNIDAAKWIAAQKKTFFARFSELIIDESTAYKHHTSQRSRAINKIKKYFRYRTCMTGTPNSNSITDVWNQVNILDDGKRLGAQYFAFRNTVCVPEQNGPKPEMIRWVDREGAEEAVFGLLQDIVIRHKFEDCVDIPPNHQYTVAYDLTARQQKAYDQMEQQQIALVTAADKKGAPSRIASRLVGKPQKLETITAVNAAAMMTKLLQIASGAVYESPNKYHVIETERYELILDLVDARKHSLVLFLWKHQRDLLVEEATARGISFCVIDGETSDKERDELVRAYQAGFYKVMFGHPKSVGHGHTLTRGTATIWASPTFDLEWFKQGSKRQHRIGQKDKTETIVVVAKGTMDEKVYDNMLAKDARMTNLLSLFETLTLH